MKSEQNDGFNFVDLTLVFIEKREKREKWKSPRYGWLVRQKRETRKIMHKTCKI